MPKTEFLEYRFHVYFRIIFLPGIESVQRLIGFRISCAFPIEHCFDFVLDVTVMIMMVGELTVKLMSQVLAKNWIKDNLIQVMKRKTISEILCKFINGLTVMQGIDDAIESFFNRLEHIVCFCKFQNT